MSVDTLEEMESEILKEADAYKAARAAFQDAESNLRGKVQAYRNKREQLKREVYGKEGLCPKESIQLLYTEGREWHGSEYTESYGLYRRVRSFCADCAEAILSRPRGGKEEFQCYKAKQEKDGFVIFVSGQWVPIPKPNLTYIEIDRRHAPETEQRFGKLIEFNGWPPRLKIEGREIT